MLCEINCKFILAGQALAVFPYVNQVGIIHILIKRTVDIVVVYQEVNSYNIGVPTTYLVLEGTYSNCNRQPYL